MAISKEIKFLPKLHAELVILRDSLGHERRLTIPLVRTEEVDGERVHKRSDPDKDIEQEIADMAARERVVLEHAAERGHIEVKTPPEASDQADGFAGDYKGCCP